MTRFNLSIKILTVMLLITGIAILARQTRACSSCDSHRTMLSQNDQNMNNMNNQNMNNMNMNQDNTAQPQRVPQGYALSPVSNTQVKITKDTPYTIIGDRRFYFASEQEKQEFLQDPQKYMNSMLPENSNTPPATKEE
jgi:YHS domain-containing protein